MQRNSQRHTELHYMLAYPEVIFEHVQLKLASHCGLPENQGKITHDYFKLGVTRRSSYATPISTPSNLPHPYCVQQRCSMAAGGVQVQVLWSPNETREFATYSNELRLYSVLNTEVN